MWEDIALEIARTERECFERVRSRLAAQQLGEAWIDLVPGDDKSEVFNGPGEVSPVLLSSP